MTGIMKKVTEFYKKDECSKYYKLGKTLGTYVVGVLDSDDVELRLTWSAL